MKTKKLTIALLVLAIVTTLSAGTLAIYTTRIENAESTNVAAKTFALTLDQAETESFNLKMAPGEVITTPEFSLTNAKNGAISEVGMDLRLNISGDMSSLRKFFDNFNNVEIELLHKQENGEFESLKTWTKADLNDIDKNEANVDLNNGLALLYDADGKAIENKQTFAFRVTWVDTNTAGDIKTQTDRGNKASGGSFKLYVKATQHVESAPVAPENPEA